MSLREELDARKKEFGSSAPRHVLGTMEGLAKISVNPAFRIASSGKGML